jgi:hypothetical protein
MSVFELICQAEDAWSWMALLCGNHVGELSAWLRPL